MAQPFSLGLLHTRSVSIVDTIKSSIFTKTRGRGAAVVHELGPYPDVRESQRRPAPDVSTIEVSAIYAINPVSEA